MIVETFALSGSTGLGAPPPPPRRHRWWGWGRGGGYPPYYPTYPVAFDPIVIETQAPPATAICPTGGQSISTRRVLGGSVVRVYQTAHGYYARAASGQCTGLWPTPEAATRALVLGG